jgi:hypothetical protein
MASYFLVWGLWQVTCHPISLNARLSALLAEATSDPLYLQAANESADFIHSHLYNARNIVQDYIFTDSDRACEVQTSVDPTSSGLMIEGLSILASITNSTSTRNL